MYRLRSSRSRYPYFFLHRGQREAETLKMSVSITTSVGHFGGRKFAGGRQGAKTDTDSEYAECSKSVDKVRYDTIL